MSDHDKPGVTDPYREPDNATVDDWMGQRVQRDEERAEQIAAGTDDPEEAERRFEEQSEAKEWHEAHVQQD
jgi:hypothetical protein